MKCVTRMNYTFFGTVDVDLYQTLNEEKMDLKKHQREAEEKASLAFIERKKRLEEVNSNINALVRAIEHYIERSMTTHEVGRLKNAIAKNTPNPYQIGYVWGFES